MVILNFTSTPRHALRRGFIKGLCSPSMVFGCHEVPPVQEIAPIKMKNTSAKQALANDWMAIGNDLNTVTVNYGKKACTASAK